MENQVPRVSGVHPQGWKIFTKLSQSCNSGITLKWYSLCASGEWLKSGAIPFARKIIYLGGYTYEVVYQRRKRVLQ